jgi:hypothetical protein
MLVVQFEIPMGTGFDFDFTGLPSKLDAILHTHGDILRAVIQQLTVFKQLDNFVKMDHAPITD